MCAYRYVCLGVCVCMCESMCVCVWGGVHLDVMHTYINVNKYIYACTHACIHKYMYINVYIYIRKKKCANKSVPNKECLRCIVKEGGLDREYLRGSVRKRES